MRSSKRSGGSKNAGYIMLVFVCVILSFAVTLQVRSVKANTQSTVLPDTARAEDLQQRYNTEKERADKLEAQLKTYREELEGLRKEFEDADGDISKVLQEQLIHTEILAGLVDVSGPGVIVTMDDTNTQPLVQGTDPNNYIIHDTDVLKVLNELRDAGAEALSINDERILATSEVRCAGNVISINNTRTSVPFVIKAIGDPEKLSAGLMMRNGIVDMLSQWGISVKVEQLKEVQIPAYRGGLNFEYATPVQSEVGS